MKIKVFIAVSGIYQHSGNGSLGINMFTYPTLSLIQGLQTYLVFPLSSTHHSSLAITSFQGSTWDHSWRTGFEEPSLENCGFFCPSFPGNPSPNERIRNRYQALHSSSFTYSKCQLLTEPGGGLRVFVIAELQEMSSPLDQRPQPQLQPPS
jgi:hypothetical protein